MAVPVTLLSACAAPLLVLGARAGASVPTPAPTSPVAVPTRARAAAAPATTVRTSQPGGLLGGVVSVGASSGSLNLGLLPILGGGPLVDLNLPGLHVTVGGLGSSAPSGGPTRAPSSPPTGGARPSSARHDPPSRSGHGRRGGARGTTGAQGSMGVGAVTAGPTSRAGRAPSSAAPSSPVGQALPPPPPSVYATLRQSFPYLAAVAFAAAVLVFGFVLVVAAMARRRDPVAATAAPARARSRPLPRPRPRPRPRKGDEWDYTFDATHADEPTLPF